MTTAPFGPSRVRPVLGLGSLLALLLAVAVGVLVGPVGLPAGTAVRALFDWVPGIDGSGISAAHHSILFSWRLPRVVLGALVGASLAMSGAAYQGVFRNPLADPYLLGAAAGAGLGATVAIVNGARGAIGLAAFAGALFAVVVAYGLGRAAGGRSGAAIILAGVAVAAFLTATQTYLQQRNTDNLREVYVWILGRLSTNGWGDVLSLLPYAVVSGVVIFLLRRHLDVLSVGEDEAGALGMPVARVRLILVTAATLATSAAVSVSGLIGFVGIIVPHVVRLVAGSSYRVVIPLSMMFGAAFMVVTDLGARTIMSPAELPIGVVTAFLGAPFFLLVLRRSRRALE
ncbi:MAG TPA: iron ABC transporter permease [Acidimicrobiia bacterium]|nr:iron ABC transporter permease [Acidimicrobiia bacterium]